MVKGEFYTRIRDKDDRDKIKANKVNGWIDTDKDIGYYKFEPIWYAVDIKSGLSFVNGDTRSEAIKKLTPDRLRLGRNRPDYDRLCVAFSKDIAEQEAK